MMDHSIRSRSWMTSSIRVCPPRETLTAPIAERTNRSTLSVTNCWKRQGMLDAHLLVDVINSASDARERDVIVPSHREEYKRFYGVHERKIAGAGQSRTRLKSPLTFAKRPSWSAACRYAGPRLKSHTEAQKSRLCRRSRVVTPSLRPSFPSVRQASGWRPQATCSAGVGIVSHIISG